MEGGNGAAGGENSFCRGQELRGPGWWLPGSWAGVGTLLGLPALSLPLPLHPPHLGPSGLSVLFCCPSSSLPLSSSLLWSLTPARLPREPGEGCEGHCPHPCPMPGLAGALCLLRGFMNPCVCGNGAGSLCLSGGRGAPWGRDPVSVCPHPLHYGWGRGGWRERELPVRGQCLPGPQLPPPRVRRF